MVWLTLVSGAVSTHGNDVSGGAPLENLLDSHLGRRKVYISTKPSFLDDPDLRLLDDTSDAYVGSPGRSNYTGSSIPSSTGSEPLPDEASPEQHRGREEGDRDAQALKSYKYERQKNPKK